MFFCPFQDCKSPQGDVSSFCKEVEAEVEEKERDDEEDEDDEEESGMDYDSLMAYFESLKESTA
jgi:hypothetical protein